jgi:ribonuclease J
VQIIVHRGLNQIGGTITEFRTETSRIFIDMGDNLPGNGSPLNDEERQALVNSFFENNKREKEAVYYTHGHPDHVGMMALVPKNVKQYMSEGTRQLLLIKHQTILEGLRLQEKPSDITLAEIKENENIVSTLKGMETWCLPEGMLHVPYMETGDIRVSPFYVSHSIYDAYMFLIEADGKRTLHTGDYREHGYIGKNLIRMIERYIGRVDVLITEGTMLKRTERVMSEVEVSTRMEKLMETFPYTFVLTSSTDIERLASVNKAAGMANRTLRTCSLMMSRSLNFFTSLSGMYRSAIYKFKNYESIFPFTRKKVRDMKNNGFVLLCGPNDGSKIQQVMKMFPEEDTLLIYSCWDGYYKIEKQVKTNGRYAAIRNMFNNCVDVHTAGHAECRTIERVIKSTQPRDAIIGIHKEEDASLTKLNIPDDLKVKIIPENNSLEWIVVK